jgi:excisionase family DNA binding protein
LSDIGIDPYVPFDSFDFLVSWRRDLGGIVARRADNGVVFPPDDLEGLLDLARFMEQHTEPGMLLGPDGEQIPLPAEVYGVLVNVVQAMREGKAISVLPQTQRMTTQEAADFLGISRPTFVKLLERGEIPFEQPGRHRRVFLSDLLAYQQKRQTERRVTLNRMTEEASEAGIYEGSPADYTAALKAERKRLARNRS